MGTLVGGLMTEFDEEVFRAVVDEITAGKDGSLTFRFVDGSEIVVAK